MEPNKQDSNKLIISIVVILVLAAAIYFIINKSNTKSGIVAVNDYKNDSYVIDGATVKLTNGYAETEAAPGSATKIVTKFFGNELKKDLDGDGREDVAFIITQDMGGSGTFFYVVANLDTLTGHKVSDAVLLGDRIAPQTIESGEGRSIIVNYLDRAHGEAMSVDPSVGKSMRLLLDPQTLQFGVVAQDFEGEADPSRMTLGMHTWKWVSLKTDDGKTVLPKKDVFTLTFNKDNTFQATTDCNGVGGEYSSTQSALAFSQMMSTLMYCEGSQEAEFKSILENTAGYEFTSKGELILNLKGDKGVAYFR